MTGNQEKMYLNLNNSQNTLADNHIKYYLASWECAHKC